MIQSLKNVCIFGMGLMGTSLAYSLKKHDNFNGKITGIVRTTKSKEWIVKQKLADEVYLADTHNLESIIKRTDFLIIGLPVLDAIDLIEKLVNWRYEGLITDMCSTRFELEKKIREKEQKFRLRFVGSHPMCGSEVSGPEGYVKDLYINKLCILINKLSKEDQEDRSKRRIKSYRNFLERNWYEDFILRCRKS
ncbi:MAG: hypothetical protein KatS3mg129_3085 [Leptospiraceae bacterium]|nr:MAG: hypothetical protein KatS3mg129_3085 [Leptospiraceae bacterium]